MELGKHVLDKTLLDVDGFRAGKVDDLELELAPGGELRVAGIITGPLALARHYGPAGRWLAGGLYRLLGLRRPCPVAIAWERVSAIDVAVHLDVSRSQAGLDAFATAAERLVSRLPGS